MIDFNTLQQLMRGSQPAGPGILGQEMDARALGGPGFLGQVDAQPVVGGEQTGPMFDQNALAAMQQMGQQMQQQAQSPQPAPPAPMPMPQMRQTVGMPQMNNPAEMWMRRQRMPQLGPLGGGM